MKNELSNLVPKKSSTQSLIFHTFFEVWSARSSNSDMGGAQKNLGSADPAMLS